MLRALFRPSRPAVAPAPDFSVTIDGAEIPVKVRRHPRAQVYRLRYDGARAQLRLTMPPRARLDAARRWVLEQQDWVRRQRARQAGPAHIGDGASLPWGDGSLTIEWAARHPRTPVIAGDRLLVGGAAESLRPRVQRWLMARARSEFSQATHAMAARAALTCTGVSVGDPRGRWGSCTASGRIRYSWRIIMAPDFVRQALVAHEVAHLAHMNHGPDFYALVRDLCGDAHDRSRAWLKAKGPQLHALQF